jgi:formate C-acetyltransferase
MKDIGEVKDAFLKQMDYWVTWNVNIVNIFESVARNILPQPVVSAAMEGCMRKGADVMRGGAKYNSTGLSGIGLGNTTDCLAIIDRLCFKDKTCTTRELYDAIMHNWEGYDDIRSYINNQAPRYGNGESEADEFCTWLAQSYAEMANNKTGPRGRYAAGLYPVTMHVVYGALTGATPDGRCSGEPLSDGISAVQGMDRNGPTAILNSVTCFDHRAFSNGVLLNMRFHPTVLSAEEGFDKLRALMSAYFFEMGGGEMQLNIVSSDTLRDAQERPDNYKDLVVRIAGFSAYFVEVYKASQDDLIRRTELGM